MNNTDKHAKVRLMPTIAAWLVAAITCGSFAAAEQAAPVTPFTSGVQISVVAAKPARNKNRGDKKLQSIEMTVKFANIDTRQTYEGYTATISALGEHSSETKIKKVLMQKEVLLSLPPLKTQQQVCPEVTTSFDDVGRNKSGCSYYGWIVVVKDPQGKVAKVKSSVVSLEKFTVLASKLVKGTCFNATLQAVEDPHPPRRAGK